MHNERGNLFRALGPVGTYKLQTDLQGCKKEIPRFFRLAVKCVRAGGRRIRRIAHIPEVRRMRSVGVGGKRRKNSGRREIINIVGRQMGRSRPWSTWGDTVRPIGEFIIHGK